MAHDIYLRWIVLISLWESAYALQVMQTYRMTQDFHENGQSKLDKINTLSQSINYKVQQPKLYHCYHEYPC